MLSAKSANLGGDELGRINLAWLTWLRWGAVAGQLAVLIGVRAGMQVPLSLTPLLGVVLIEVLLNLGATAWVRLARPVSQGMLAANVAADIVLFTALLYFSGGPSNPFSFLYLIHIAVAALLLRPAWMWSLVGLTLICSAALFVDHVPLAMGHEHDAHMGHAGGETHYGMHLKGMWVALAVAAAFIGYFLHRVTQALRDRERELQASRERTQQSERLAALATLAAGAAHELASPLSTIAVVAKELERQLRDNPALDDALLIRAEVERCSEILRQMAADAGQQGGESARAVTSRALVEAALLDLPGAARVRLEIEPDATSLVLPERALSRALRGLVKNALEASELPVDVKLRRQGGDLELCIIDRGSGMTEDVRARAMDPFFTTKPTGHGMGLGLFLAYSVAQQLGGALRLESQPGEGTKVYLTVPAAAPATICRIPAGSPSDVSVAS